VVIDGAVTLTGSYNLTLGVAHNFEDVFVGIFVGILRTFFLMRWFQINIVRSGADEEGTHERLQAQPSIAAALRARRATEWPFWAKSRAVASPMPRLAPVIKTGAGWLAIGFPSAEVSACDIPPGRKTCRDDDSDADGAPKGISASAWRRQVRRRSASA
jgi:hypothetical protein